MRLATNMISLICLRPLLQTELDEFVRESSLPLVGSPWQPRAWGGIRQTQLGHVKRSKQLHGGVLVPTLQVRLYALRPPPILGQLTLTTLEAAKILLGREKKGVESGVHGQAVALRPLLFVRRANPCEARRPKLTDRIRFLAWWLWFRWQRIALKGMLGVRAPNRYIYIYIFIYPTSMLDP